MTQQKNQNQRISPLQYVKHVGPRRAEAIAGLGISTVRDLLYYFPRGYLDRSTIIPIRDVGKYIATGELVTIIGEVFRLQARRTKKSRLMMFFMTLKDETGYLQCVWFKGYQWLKDAFEIGEVLAVSARPALDHLGRPQFTHPQFDRLKSVEEDEPDWGKMFNTGAIIPKYKSTAELTKIGLDSRGFRRILRNATTFHLGSVEESLPDAIRTRQGLDLLKFALKNVHFPENHQALEEARARLKFDELFYLQLLLAMRKRIATVSVPGLRLATNGTLAADLIARLPFQLTGAQRRVLQEITTDLGSGKPMNRLLQGDVGSGKTIVALVTALHAIQSGYQAAFLAPTEVLADQHYRTLAGWLKGTAVNVRLLIGGQKKKLREDVLEDIRRGAAQLIVGTHAVLEENVEFHSLGLAVIDEQHRFGVAQRAAIRQKGTNPHVLVMTATPIPRTLSMTLYGDLDVSVIDELPANRRPIRTAVRMEDQKDKVYDFLNKEVRRGRQVYVVFPLIEKSEKVDLKAATKEFEHLRDAVFHGCRLGLLHGRMKTEEKDDVMARFKSGEIQILVATTVIEVGIDIPNATVMMIENAERFGLSQLHQLRGRVGRGADQSYCILMSNEKIFARTLRGKEDEEKEEEIRAAKVRLDTMVATTDGFRIAEVDLQLRGPGEFFGTRQSGMPSLRIADLIADARLVTDARAAAFGVIERDPQLRLAEHQPIRRHFESYYKDLLDLGSVS